jgi:transposase
MKRANKIILDGFYPESLKITKITETKNQIEITLKSQKHSHKCWKCGEEMNNYNATYVRGVQNLPILGKKVELKIIAYKYYCENTECEVKTFTEDYGEFIGKSKRMTDRCEELVKTLAIETSCEGAARICKKMGVTVSGDTIIGMLKKSAEKIEIFKEYEQPITTLGVDDFAYKKGRTYCTIVCDGESHRPIEVLEGRDGKNLEEWLKNNKKHMKVTEMTRDRASAYSKTISDIIPEAMQIADRFHLHQNLSDAVKEALKGILPNEIPIPNDYALISESNELNKSENEKREVTDEEIPFYLGETEKPVVNISDETDKKTAEDSRDKKK